MEEEYKKKIIAEEKRKEQEVYRIYSEIDHEKERRYKDKNTYYIDRNVF